MSTRNHTVSVIKDEGGRVSVSEISTGLDLTYDQATRLARRESGLGAVFRKYGPTSIAYVGRGITAVVVWERGQ